MADRCDSIDMICGTFCIFLALRSSGLLLLALGGFLLPELVLWILDAILVQSREGHLL